MEHQHQRASLVPDLRFLVELLRFRSRRHLKRLREEDPIWNGCPLKKSLRLILRKCGACLTLLPAFSGLLHQIDSPRRHSRLDPYRDLGVRNHVDHFVRQRKHALKRVVRRILLIETRNQPCDDVDDLVPCACERPERTGVRQLDASQEVLEFKVRCRLCHELVEVLQSIGD